MTDPWRSRIVGTGEEAPDQLMANPRNWRIHPKAQQDALAGVLSEVGWVQNIIVNRRTGHVVDGHARVEIAISREEATVPVVYVDLDEDEEAIVLASLDPLSALAGTDKEKLAELLADITVTDEALNAMFAALKPDDPKDGLTDPDAVPTGVEPVTKAGDLWLLGEHRLLCGDSTSGADVGRLLDGGKPHLCVTDPPYGVEYEGGANNRRKRAALAGDESTALYASALAHAPGNVAYLWHAGTVARDVYAAALAARYEIRAQIIWSKTSAHFGAFTAHYLQAHEPLLYCVRGAAAWTGPTNERTVWEIPQPSRNELHPTQKPVECMERPIRNHEGDVYDPFLGSGTTLIAAERLGRRCYAMEIEPKYVDVAVKRWENFTGREAVREGAKPKRKAAKVG